MIRLLLKIHKVEIHLKEKVNVQILIKKDQNYFYSPSKPELEDSVATFNSHIQFFMSPQVDHFEIQVMLVLKKIKKFAGMCQINLKDWNQNNLNHTQTYLLKSPDPQALLSYDFIFMSSQIPEMDVTLISLEEYEKFKRTSNIKQIEEQNNELIKQNNKLVDEIIQLKEENEILNQDKNHMEEEKDQIEQQFYGQLKTKDEKISESQTQYSKVCNKIDKMMQLVNEYGEEQLIDKVKICYDGKS